MLQRQLETCLRLVASKRLSSASLSQAYHTPILLPSQSSFSWRKVSMVRNSDHVKFFSLGATQESQTSCHGHASSLGSSHPLLYPVGICFSPTEWPTGLGLPRSLGDKHPGLCDSWVFLLWQSGRAGEEVLPIGAPSSESLLPRKCHHNSNFHAWFL